MGGKSSASAPTRYAGIQVQTSALGVEVPIVWGTARCKCNLVWYGDFKSKAQKASTGKGGGTTTGYTYSASLVLGICEGPIADITSVWVDSKQYTGGAGKALRQAGLSMSTGAIGQSPWGYLTTNFPSQAIGYSGLCIAYASNYPLGSSAATPNHAFEVVSTVRLGALNLPDAGPKDIVSDFFLNSRYGLPGWTTGLLDTTSLNDWGNYCLAANLVLSPALDQAQTGSAFLTELFLATNSACVWSEGVLKFIPYGDTQITGNGVTWTPNLTPVYALDSSNFIPQSDGDDPLTVDLQDQSDAYNIVQIEYLDRANQYNTAIATAQDLANIDQYGRRKKNPTTVHSICAAAVAQVAAQLYLQRTLYVRAQYKFDLDWSFALLEPGDIVEITDPAAGLNAYPVRITGIEDDENLRRSITAEDLLAGVSHAPLYNNQEGLGFVSNRGVDPGGVEANLLVWSEDFTQSQWSRGDLTIAANAAADPLFGAATADRLVADTTNTGHHVLQSLAAPLSEVAYTFSAYLQPDGVYNCVQIRLGDGTGNNAYIDVDLHAGVVLTGPINGGTGAGADGGMVRIGTSNWYRVWVTCIFSAPPAINAVIQLLDNSGNSTFAGDASHGIYAWGAQVKQGVDVPQYAYAGAAVAGPFLFNPPASLADGPQSEACAAVAGGANWGGCNVWISADGTNYQQVGVIDQPARYGYLESALPQVADPDTTSSTLVDLGVSAGQLSGGTAADADAATTLCLVDNELIAYEAATLTAQGRYTLATYFRRGLMGTASAAHASGAPFVRMDDAVFAFPYIAAQAGKQVYVKFQSFNIWGEGLQDLSVCNPYLITLDPQGVAAGIAGGGNRICFSDFDKRSDDGWFTGYNPAGLSIARSSGVYLGVPFNQMATTSTAAGQTISQKSIPFPVTGGERLAVTAGLQSFTGWTCHAAIGFLDSSLASIAEYPVGPTLSNAAFNTQVQGFIQAPPNAVAAWFEAYAASTAAGQAVSFSLSRPMVCGAAAEQTTFPTYVKGPAAEYGADITGNWTAAAIVGQAAAATDTTIQSGATKNVVSIGATAPTSPSAFDLWNDTSTPPGLWKTWNGSSWTTVSIGGVFSSNLYETAGGSPATLANFKTVLGTAAAITGQSPWATSGIPTSILTNPTANLIYNPSAALGDQDWAVSASSFGAVTAGGANQVGTYFYNTASTNSAGCAQHQDIPCFAGIPYSLQAMLYSSNLTGSGAQVRAYVEWLDISGAHIVYSPVCAVGGGNGWTYASQPNFASPSGSVTARVWMDIWGPGAWTNAGGACAWSQLKLEQNTVCTPYSDETTNGALYRDGNTIEYWKPAQQNADQTGLNVAAGITGQAPAATDGTIQPGATNNPVFAQSTDPYGGGTVPDGAFWYDEANGTPYIGKGGGWILFTPQVASGTVVRTATGPASGSAASGSYTIPPNFPPYAIVALTAASGGSSWAGSNANLPGGGGSCVSKIAVSAGDLINWTLGAKGTNGTSSHHDGLGGSGSTASESTSGMSLSALGGGGAPDTPVDATGAGGAASGGNVSNTTGSGNTSNLASITITAST